MANEGSLLIRNGWPTESVHSEQAANEGSPLIRNGQPTEEVHSFRNGG